MNAHYIVVPAVDPANTREFFDELTDDLMRERVILVDNTEDGAIARQYEDRVAHCYASKENKGVAWAWNYGIGVSLVSVQRGVEAAQFLTLCSTSIRFHDGGLGLCRTADVFAENDHCPYGFESMNGWKLFTMGREMFREVGGFDEKFWPAYYEDNDYIWRCRVAGVFNRQGAPDVWPEDDPLRDVSTRKVPWIGALDYHVVGDAMALKRKIVQVDLQSLADYYARKWGGYPGEETSTTPLVGGIRQ
jgi:hypothetical protein